MKNATPAADDSAMVHVIAEELGVPIKQVRSVVDLLNAGNTIPFIARYRKEVTGGLDEVALRAIEDALERLHALASRKATVLASIAEQGLLTEQLRRQIETCQDIKALEAIYLPFKPKRRTRGSIAREQGLQPLADVILKQERLTRSKTDILRAYVDPARGVPDTDAALRGALDIIAEQWSESADLRAQMVAVAEAHGKISSKLKRGKVDAENKFELYLDHQEPVRKVPSHRVLAMLRGEAEDLLRVGLDVDCSQNISNFKRQLVHNRQFEFFTELNTTVEDCVERLLMPATESTILQGLKERAEQEAIAVFGKNLHELLMAPPAGPRVTIGIDPGFRTGCKVAVVDATGKYLASTTIYPTPPKSDLANAAKTLLELIRRHAVELIAIGNGTASRETDAFVAELIREHRLTIIKVMVSESGASIYSASELAAKEFPDLDLTVRGAISIARRLQDPLAELVKSDPKSIGVGQYQHDVNQSQLRKCLDRVVESCVNHVGVDLNTASAPLLSYVAGIGPKLAESIVAHRDSHGRFLNRQELLSVPKLGKKAFEQAAGFLRIRDGNQPLDNSAVHPERYSIVRQMAKSVGADPSVVFGNAALVQTIKPDAFVSGDVGLPTINDILSELAKPGRDPRKEFKVARFADDVRSLEDLQTGLVLEGVITNVTHFGAFIDIGVHQDALIHISQLSNEFVRDPNQVVSVGDIVKVKILEVDISRKRISATRKF
ncbi:MAG: RNA-binding transcriptional accessory protein [Planctomycetaceae bacterium]|nr:RNA-binding transcriptional accessory protein [Planctomycetaceae bacterium]